MEEIVINGVNITEEVKEAFNRKFLIDAAAAKMRQTEAAEARKKLGLVASREARVFIDPFWYHYWGQREGYEIWQDEKEVNRFIRDTPELRFEKDKGPARVCFAGVKDSPLLVEGKPVSREEEMTLKC